MLLEQNPLADGFCRTSLRSVVHQQRYYLTGQPFQFAEGIGNSSRLLPSTRIVSTSKYSATRVRHNIISVPAWAPWPAVSPAGGHLASKQANQYALESNPYGPTA